MEYQTAFIRQEIIIYLFKRNKLIVAPTFPNIEIWGIFSYDWILNEFMVDKLNFVFVFVLVDVSLGHLKENRHMCLFG